MHAEQSRGLWHIAAVAHAALVIPQSRLRVARDFPILAVESECGCFLVMQPGFDQAQTAEVLVAHHFTGQSGPRGVDQDGVVQPAHLRDPVRNEMVLAFEVTEHGAGRRDCLVSRFPALIGQHAGQGVGLVKPLVQAGIIPADWPVTVNAVSGYSGGGKAMIAAFEGGQGDPFRAYGLTQKHKHVPEMQLHTGLSGRPMFAPAVGAYAQGMLVEVPFQLGALPDRPSVADVHAALRAAYAGERFVSVATLEQSQAMTGLEPQALNGTNQMRLFVFGDPSGDQALLVAQLDNLGKGASGAAVQNLNLMLGFDEAAGL